MSLSHDFLTLLKKKQEGLDNITISSPYAGKNNDDLTQEERFARSFLDELSKAEKEKQDRLSRVKSGEEDIAPLPDYSNDPLEKAIRKQQGEEEEEEELDFFDAGSFSDGFQASDIIKAPVATIADIATGIVEGVLNTGESIADFGYYLGEAASDLLGDGNAVEEWFDEKQEVAANRNFFNEWLGEFRDKTGISNNTLLGRTSQAATQGIGQAATFYSMGSLGQLAKLGTVGQTALTTGTVFASSSGSSIGEALSEGASDKDAMTFGLSVGAFDAVWEGLSGGLGRGLKAIGVSRGIGGLDDIFADKLTSKIANYWVKNAAQAGVKAAGEGLEEVLSGLSSAVLKKMTYMPEADLKELIKDENLLESFVVGALSSAPMQAGDVITSSKNKSNLVTGLNASEEAVVKKEAENRIAEAEKDGKKLSNKDKNDIYERVMKDLDKGYISTDTIEEVLGGDSYKTYQDTVKSEDALKSEFDELDKVKANDATLGQSSRYNELKNKLEELKTTSERDFLQRKYKNEAYEIARGSRLEESYNERARRGQAFTADLSKYDEKQRTVVQRAIDSGILNNTNRTHEFVDIIARLSADKDVPFDFTNNAKLKESGFAIDGVTVNGYVTKDGITINMDSPKAWQSTVGHEITHVLEGTELYTELQNAIVNYAKTKGDYQSRLDALTKVYEGVKDADINAELTADLVGDYLFQDEDFVNHLSANHRNVFQKIYDEIKYLVKVTTAGTKEARELERVKHAFERAYKAQKNTALKDGTAYSLSIKHTDGTVEELADARNLTNEQAIDYLKQARKGKIQRDSYVPVRKDTPQVIIDTLTQVNEKVQNRSLVMQVKKAQQAMRSKNAGNSSERFGDNVRGHALTAKQIVEIVNKLDDPSAIFYQTNRQDKEGNALPNNIAVFVEYDNNGTESVAVIEFDSSIDPDYIGKEFGDTEYHTVVTVFEPDVERDGMPFDYAEELLSNPDNILLDIERRQPTGSATGEKHPNTSSELPSTEGIISQKEKFVNSKYSLSKDTEGRELSSEQQEYFKDSVVRDENGNLKVMYHGTPNGEYTVFRSGTYFTENKEYADKYQNPSASSLNSRKVATSPKTFEVYLNITKPFDINDPEARSIYINDYIKGGNAIGINPYLSDAEYDKITSIDWTEGEDLREFLVENGYDYDGLVLDEGAVGGYGEDVEHRGTSYVVFSPEQVKKVDNQSPTSDPDIRFSLSEPVEESNDLMALHNLRGDELLKSLELGGLAMPSIAVIKAETGHEKYGDVSLILPKETIDPKASKDNKVYGGDAWTPTHPKIEYKASEKVQQRIRDKYYDLANKVGYDTVRPLYRYVSELESTLNSYGGESALIENLYDDTNMMQVYLEDSGKGKVDPVVKETRTEMSAHEKAKNQMLIDRLGEDVIREIEVPEGVSIPVHRRAYVEEHRAELASAWESVCRDVLDLTDEQVQNIMRDTSDAMYARFVREANEYLKNGGVTVKSETDYKATDDAIREAAAGGYKSWVDSLFKGVEEGTGIRNNLDAFTASGNRRSWNALHWENTLENVVRAMRSQDQTGADAFAPTSAIFAVAQKQYGSIGEIKSDSNRLGKASEEEYKKMQDSYASRLVELANSIKDPGERNSYFAVDEAAMLIVDAVRNYKTKPAMLRYMQSFNKRVTSETVDGIVSLVNDIANMPTGYFEAKPMRAVGFDEVGVFVIPNNADVKLKQELLNRGYSIAEYDPNVEGDRQKVVNSFEQYKFSLSDVGETSQAYGNFATPARDLRLETAQEDIAPVAETAGNVQETLPDDYAPMTEDEATVIENEALDGLTDEDAPPEYETPYYNVQRDAVTVDNKSLKEITKRTSEFLGLGRADQKILEGIIQNYSQNENLTRDDLYSELKKNFSVLEDYTTNDEVVQLKKHLKNMRLYVSDEVKLDFGSGADGYSRFLRSNFGKLKIVKDRASGVPVDSAYMELSDLYPSYFPEDIINPADQLRKISEMASMSAEEYYPMELSDAEIEAVTDMVYTDISDYMNEVRLTSATEASHAPISDSDAPMVEIKTEPENKVLSVKELYEQKKNNYRNTLAAYEVGKEKALANFSEAIGKKLDEYNGLRNKNTKKAHNLLQQIENLRLRRDNVQVDYANRIAKQQARLEAFESKDYSEFENKELAFRRKDLHKQIVDKTKAQFEAQGYDLDEVLRSAKDLSTIATVDNTPQRVMEKSLGYKEGQILSDITVNKVAQNETEGIKWLNSFTNKKDGLLAKISKQYNIKPGSKESAAAQMYAEGFYVDKENNVVQYGDTELAKDFPDAKVRENIKGLAKDQRIREIYDETLAKINESRARNAYPEIPKLDNYFLHFRAMDDTFSRLGLPFNPNDIRAKDLPTDLNGVTADLKPGQPYFSSAMHRRGQRTSFDLLGGLEKYLSSAKNQIYHIDDIQTLRALRNYIADSYGQANGLEGLDALDEDIAQEKIKQVYGAHLSTFAKFLNEEANVIAGKTALIDRGLEGIVGRRAMTFMDTVNRQVGSNMVGYNVSSALTNLIAPVQAFAKTNKYDFIKGFAQTVSNKVNGIKGKSDGFAEASPVMIRRNGEERFHRTAWQKLSDPGYALMGAVDNFSTEIIARAKYNELTRKGMDSETAHVETDKWVSRLMGDRSLGQQPQLYNSKVLGLVTKFQLEVRNQLDSQFYDTIKEAEASTEDIQNGLERNAKKAAKIASTFFTLAVGQHVFGKVFESIAGYNPAFDIISVIAKAFGWDDDEEDEDTVLDNIEQAFFELMGDMPYTSILEGGRIPISSALPIEQLYQGKDQYGNEKSRLETIKETLPYYLMPGGYGQLKKTTQGLEMFNDDHPISGSYTDSGKLRFPVEDTLEEMFRAGLFGQYASGNARDYFDNERDALDEKKTQEFIDSGISIQDYWDYREGLKGLTTINDKADYIYGLDLPIDVKNLFINNLTDREEDIDLSGMEGFEDFEEFDFAVKNPEKYEWLTQNGITVAEYEAMDADTKEEYNYAFRNPEKYEFLKEIGVSYSDFAASDDVTKEGYDWAFKNPDKYKMSQAITEDFREFYSYKKAMNEFDAKDENGETVSGLKKQRVADYISSLDLEYGRKLLLFKSQYPSDDSYNKEIVEYLDSRSDISYEEMVAILTELGFRVNGNTVSWD